MLKRKKNHYLLGKWRVNLKHVPERKKSRAAPLILPRQSFWTHLLNHVRVLTLHAWLSSRPHSTKVREVYSVKFFLVSSTLLNRSGQEGPPCSPPPGESIVSHHRCDVNIRFLCECSLLGWGRSPLSLFSREFLSWVILCQMLFMHQLIGLWEFFFLAC